MSADYHEVSLPSIGDRVQFIESMEHELLLTGEIVNVHEHTKTGVTYVAIAWDGGGRSVHRLEQVRSEMRPLYDYNVTGEEKEKVMRSMLDDLEDPTAELVPLPRRSRLREWWASLRRRLPLARLLVVALLATAVGGCRFTSCDDLRDPQCVRDNVTEEEAVGVIRHYGACYAFGRALCDRADYCNAIESDAETCTDWWIANVCLVGWTDARTMDHCSRWAPQLDCGWFDAKADYYDNPQPCADLYPPLEGVDE